MAGRIRAGIESGVKANESPDDEWPRHIRTLIGLAIGLLVVVAMCCGAISQLRV
jgi:hypothetical protein